MADFYPLIARAVAKLPQNTDAARRALYERARNALVAQLRGQTPTPSESTIGRELESLEQAIRRIESESSGGPAIAVDQSARAAEPSPVKGNPDPKLVASIKSTLRDTETPELLQRYQENDRQAWSDEAFIAMREILLARGQSPPVQKGAPPPAITAAPSSNKSSGKPAIDKPPAPRWEVQLPDGTLRQAAVATELFPEILSGEIAGSLPCRTIRAPAKNGKPQKVKWSQVADSIGSSSFEARLLFRPVWAHSLRGLQIGFVLGFFTWLSLNVWNSMSAALQLSGNQYNRLGHQAAVKFGAYGIVSLYWLLQSLPLAAEAVPLPWLKSLSQQVASRALQVAGFGLCLLSITSGEMSAVFAGLWPGLSSAFGSMIAGGLAGGPPGMMIGTIVGLVRRPRLKTAPGWPQEKLTPLLLKGAFLPALISAGAITLYLRYANVLTTATVEHFLH
jgi:hypothetical protein